MVDTCVSWVEQGAVSELARQRMSRQDVAGVDVLLCWVGNEPHAFHNACSHLQRPLHAGRLMAGQIQCPYHGACFDARSGAPLSGPAVFALRGIPVKIEEGRLFFHVAGAPEGPASE